jgi:hypothetical protein
MIFSRTMTVPWDDLDSQGCADDGMPDWDSMIVVGPMKRRDSRGHTSLEWTVTVQCRPRPAPAQPAPASTSPDVPRQTAAPASGDSRGSSIVHTPE